MLRSMTGYGRASTNDSYRTITIELKSVNNRYLDIDFAMPKTLGFLEDQLKTLISGQVKRGKVNVNITIEGESLMETAIDIDWAILDQYHKQMNTIAEKYDWAIQWDATEVLHLPGVFKQTEKNEHLSGIEPIILSTLHSSLEQLVHMREVEGQNLYKDICGRLGQVSELIQAIRFHVPLVLEKYQDRLTKKMHDFLDGRFEVDEARLLNEVAIYADKSDISEELLRLDSHIQQFLDIMNEKDPKGRKLDFLVQEMNREINTIGSKSNDTRISHQVVSVKSELEKIREQVQNIE